MVRRRRRARPDDTGQVALTFDDGPNLGATEKIMAILDAHGVKGTFFEVGKAIDADPQITRALYDDGHLLGNHSYHHDQWRWLDPRYPELQRTQDAFRRAIGTCPVLYRPPHGDRTPFLAQVVRDHHMHMVLWSASAGDWATNDARLVARRILAGARPGAILLLHDGLDGKPGGRPQRARARAAAHHRRLARQGSVTRAPRPSPRHRGVSTLLIVEVDVAAGCNDDPPVRVRTRKSRRHLAPAAPAK